MPLPKSAKKEKTARKKGRKSVAAAVPLSRIKSDIDFEETNTNDMLYSEEGRAVDTDDDAAACPLARKEQRSKLREQKVAQAQAEAAIVYNPICNNSVDGKRPAGCSEEDYGLFRRAQEMSRHKLNQDEVGGKGRKETADAVASASAHKRSGML